jgi:polyribonucleotide nucleotidyltransferase
VHDVVAALPDPEKEEAVKKVKTIADALREEGRAAVLAEVEARIHAEVETRIRAERADALERMRASVEKQLRLKFGALPEHVSARLAKASLDELDGIAERLLFAPSLDAALDAR